MIRYKISVMSYKFKKVSDDAVQIQEHDTIYGYAFKPEVGNHLDIWFVSPKPRDIRNNVQLGRITAVKWPYVVTRGGKYHFEEAYEDTKRKSQGTQGGKRVKGHDHGHVSRTH